MIEIYTDGAASPNTHKCGGWGVVVVRDGEASYTESGGEEDTTNNRMELYGVLVALQMLNKHKTALIKKDEISYTIFSDSMYTLNGLTTWSPAWIARGWRKADGGEVINKDLWKQLVKAKKDLTKAGFELEFKHVKGHSNDKFNDMADELAVNAKVKIAEEQKNGNNNI